MDKVGLANQALVSHGANEIEALDEDSTEAIVAVRIVDPTIRFCFSLHPWRFATTSVQLTRDTLATLANESPYEAVYTIPAGVQRLIAVRVDDTPIEFDRYDGKILCDAGETELVVADIVREVDPDFWPAYFESLVVAQLALRMCKPLTGVDPSSADARAAGLSLTAAKTADSQGRTQRKMPVGRLSAMVAGARR